MDKRPEIFKPNMSFKDSNKKAFYSYLEEPLVSDDTSIDVVSFLNNFSATNSYVFNKKVVIKTKDGVYDTKIAGKIGNRLITLDNDSINIDDIKEIHEKK